MLKLIHEHGGTYIEVPVVEPESEASRLDALTVMVRRGFQFPGSAAGSRLVSHDYEPTPPGRTVSQGSRRVAGKIRVVTAGLPLAVKDLDPGTYETTFYVFTEPEPEPGGKGAQP